MGDFYYNLLSRQDQQVYNEILSGIQQRRPTIHTSMRVCDGKRIEQIFNAIVFDNPMLFYISKNSIATLTSLRGVSINVKYIYNPMQERQLAAKLENEIDRILKEIINHTHSDYDKEVRIHDYLVENVTYDHKEFMHPYDPNCHTIIGGLLNKRAVCDGISIAAHILMEKAGIQNILINGTSSYQSAADMPHVWNMVTLGGHSHHLDVTWDNTIKASSGLTRYDYFNISDRDAAMDHAWDRYGLPKCDTVPYNYFHQTQTEVSTVTELEKIIKENVLNEEYEFCVKIKPDSQISGIFFDVLESSLNNAVAKCRGVNVESYSYSMNERQKVCAIKIIHS